MITKKKKKVKRKSRRKKFTVYGRFLFNAGRPQIEMVHVDARSMAVALRKAIPILWKRPGVRWRHHYHVNFSCQPQDSSEVP